MDTHEITWDKLIGSWRIHQLRRGHRFSTDDLLTAWLAGREYPSALRALDLGTGIGSVGLMVLGQLGPTATLTGIEAQELSFALACRTVERNGLGQRVRLLHGDLREAALEPVFDVVTGSPPYIPPGRGVISSHPQRAHARFELRGDVSDYCRAAARAMAPGAGFVFCHEAADPRPLAAIEAAGLVLRRRVEVLFRQDRPPLIALFQAERAGPREPDEQVVVRRPDGSWTAQYEGIRRAMGVDAAA